jgi:hypothetical protein
VDPVVDPAELLPSRGALKQADVFREQAQILFDSLLKSADQQTFAVLNPFLSLLLDSTSKR